MPFQYISYLELWQPICSVEQSNLCNFIRGYEEEQFCIISLDLDKWLRTRFLFKYVSYLELWQLFCLVERNHLCNFGRGYQ